MFACNYAIILIKINIKQLYLQLKWIYIFFLSKNPPQAFIIAEPIFSILSINL